MHLLYLACYVPTIFFYHVDDRRTIIVHTSLKNKKTLELIINT